MACARGRIDRPFNATRIMLWAARERWVMFTEQAPNQRLKLAGGDRSNGSGVLCPSGHELSFKCTSLGGRVTRSLSATR